MVKKIILGMSILILTVTTGHAALLFDSQKTRAGIILKLQPGPTSNKDEMVLSIALSFTHPTEKPVYEGVRIMSAPLLLDNQKNLFGFRNGDGVAQFKHPTRHAVVGNETYSYVEAEADRQENGMFSLYPMRSDPVSYSLRGVFYAQGHLFVIDEMMHLNEEKVCYSNDFSQEAKQPLQLTIKSDKQVYKAGEEMNIRVEFKNISSKPVTLFDFQDKPPGWPVPAGYFRCMVLGLNEEPIPYQLIPGHFEKYIVIEPGAIYSFDQNYNDSMKLTAKPAMNKLKMIYDTKIFVEGHWSGDYWKGRLESNEIPVVVEIKN